MGIDAAINNDILAEVSIAKSIGVILILLSQVY